MEIDWYREELELIAPHIEDWLRSKEMAGLKRLPDITSEVRAQFARISKADWVELYFDLYRQTCDELAPDAQCMEDARKRLEILKFYREREGK